MNAKLTSGKEVTTLRVAGDLISTTIQSVRAEAARVLDEAETTPATWHTFRLDLSRAKMVDSVGLNLIVGLFKKIQKRGAKMQVVCADENVLRTFLFTRLEKHVEIVKP